MDKTARQQWHGKRLFWNELFFYQQVIFFWIYLRNFTRCVYWCTKTSFSCQRCTNVIEKHLKYKTFFFSPTYWNSCRHLIGLILFFCWWNDSSYDWTAVCFAECRILVIRNRVFFLRFLYINSDHNLIRLQGRLHISALGKFALSYGCFRIPHTPWASQGFSHQAGHIYWRLGEVHITTRGLSPPFLCEQMNVTVLDGSWRSILWMESS